VEIIGFNSDYQDCKEEFTYKDSKLLSYNYYQKDFKGDWILHRKFLYEYPAPEMIVEYTQKNIDSAWVSTTKWEKKFSGDKLMERIRFYYHDTEGWSPAAKVVNTFEQGQLTETNSFLFTSTDWEAVSRRTFYYQNNLCVEMYALFNHNGVWDSISKHILSYTDMQLTQVDDYSHQTGSNNWELISKYLMDYQSTMLTERHSYYMWSDTLHWGSTYSVLYNANGNPETYSFTSGYISKDINITYEEGVGNMQAAITENPSYQNWTWLPRPVK